MKKLRKVERILLRDETTHVIWMDKLRYWCVTVHHTDIYDGSRFVVWDDTLMSENYCEKKDTVFRNNSHKAILPPTTNTT